ncbi:MAG: hypothetical protein DSY60_02220 [Persephonella sp.]|nr:MAG: hypothetical protein DSY60_02220 [Persephonella sp.]
MSAYIENKPNLGENVDLDKLKELMEKVMRLISTRSKGIFSKFLNSYELYKLYKEKGDSVIFREIMENELLYILENEYRGDTEKFLKEMRKIVFLPPSIREMYEEDLEEAIDSYKIKKFFKENEEEVRKLFSNV